MDDDGFRTVRAAVPAAPYIGGKKQLAARLVALIQRVPHVTYAEPFVGMGGIFLRRTRAPRCEVINDISGDVATFYRILQRHYQPFMDLLKWRITAREEFERLLATPPETLTDLERAARFLYLQRAAYGGKVAGRSFGVSVGTSGRFDITRLAALLDDLHSRLSGVVIERLPYGEFIDRYDSPETLFYLDPPYAGSEEDYGAGVFAPDDFPALAAQLSTLKGRFILTLNDTAAVRATFDAFERSEVTLTYTIASGAAKSVRELIISSEGLASLGATQPDMFGEF
ncbi:DNA adenine methylase [Xanthobacter flavus]|uniref:DNA adenine methylase n=1 Tax=Xanthobacter flavus TaxID=281 RepID=UPI001AE5EC1B|nr:DNA adenine methylase [Xanthobacter flavus]MBP2147910.1 DNA adenine methylase [Xanthobacter flavus]